MISASSNKPALEINRTSLKDELKRSVLLDINFQTDDTTESRTADGYKTHLEDLNKRLNSNGCHVLYTACTTSQQLIIGCQASIAVKDRSKQIQTN